MKVLILDDSAEKIGAINQLISGIDTTEPIHVDYSLDLSYGRLKLISSYYDLLILDLNIPECIGETPSFDAGSNFIDEIIETDKMKKPTDIIVLTAFDDSAKNFKEKVEHAGFLVLQYDLSEKAWRESLVSRIDYLLCCRKQWEIIPRLPKCDVAIITAVPVETKNVLDAGYRWEELKIPNDPATYNFTVFNSEQPISIIHAQLPEMGMAAAATFTAKTMLKFNPRFVVMTGIAAGISEDVNSGDIMFATDVWNYSSGKYKEITDVNGVESVDLLPDSKHILLDEVIREYIVRQDYQDVLKEIKQRYYIEKNQCMEKDLNIHFGTIACGAAVVSSDKIVHEQVIAHSRKTIGLDMESYGVCLASKLTSTTGTIPLIIKSVSDKGDKQKNDMYQDYASFTSAQFAKYLIEKVLFV